LCSLGQRGRAGEIMVWKGRRNEEGEACASLVALLLGV